MELFVTVILYAAASVWQGILLFNKRVNKQFWTLFAGFSAIVLHAHLLYGWVGLPQQQNLSLFNLASLIAGLVALLILCLSLVKPVANLVIFIFPMAIITLLAAQYFSTPWISHVLEPHQWWHILLATLAFGVMGVAALQALLLGLQERLLHRRQATGMVQVLPPVETMETMLFQLIVLGFILLSILVVTSLWMFPHIFAPYVWQKVGVSLVAWFTFAILLWGRCSFGWRGVKAVRWTLAGVGWIMIVYFGSEIFLQL